MTAGAVSGWADIGLGPIGVGHIGLSHIGLGLIGLGHIALSHIGLGHIRLAAIALARVALAAVVGGEIAVGGIVRADPGAGAGGAGENPRLGAAGAVVRLDQPGARQHGQRLVRRVGGGNRDAGLGQHLRRAQPAAGHPQRLRPAAQQDAAAAQHVAGQALQAAPRFQRQRPHCIGGEYSCCNVGVDGRFASGVDALIDAAFDADVCTIQAGRSAFHGRGQRVDGDQGHARHVGQVGLQGAPHHLVLMAQRGRQRCGRRGAARGEVDKQHVQCPHPEPPSLRSALTLFKTDQGQRFIEQGLAAAAAGVFGRARYCGMHLVDAAGNLCADDKTVALADIGLEAFVHGIVAVGLDDHFAAVDILPA